MFLDYLELIYDNHVTVRVVRARLAQLWISSHAHRMPAPPAIASPCIQVCVVDGESGLCLGCYRTLAEVAGWTRLTAEAREAVMVELPQRRARIRPEKLGLFG
jgi:predicted Fe-S protein YdhL (DUF1289 family)